jgi:hypothetical protein
MSVYLEKCLHFLVHEYDATPDCGMTLDDDEVRYIGAHITALTADNARLLKALTDARAYLDKGLDKMAFNIIRRALNTGKEVMPDATQSPPAGHDIGPGDQAVAGAAKDAILHGMGVMLDGQQVPLEDFYAKPTVQAQIDEAKLRQTLHDLITEQSEGEWDDKTIAKDVEVFLTAILALIRKGDQP